MPLPPGLALNPVTGVISGTPNQAGTYNFTLRVRDSQGSQRDIPLSMTIAAYQPPSLSGSLAQFMTRNSAYSSGLTLAGGTPPVVWSIASGTLPTGVTINTSTGVISGTPTDTSYGSRTVTVRAVDASGASAQSAQTFSYQNSLTLTGTLPDAPINSSYSASFTRGGGHSPFTYALAGGSLPNGLSLNASTGVISGVPTQGGDFTPTIRVTDAAGNVATASDTLTISTASVPAAPSITSFAQVDANGGDSGSAHGPSVNWTNSVPSDGGSAIIRYEYELVFPGETVTGNTGTQANGSVNLSTSSRIGSATLRVRAVNAIGPGAWSPDTTITVNPSVGANIGLVVLSEDAPAGTHRIQFTYFGDGRLLFSYFTISNGLISTSSGSWMQNRFLGAARANGFTIAFELLSGSNVEGIDNVQRAFDSNPDTSHSALLDNTGQFRIRIRSGSTVLASGLCTISA